MGQYQRKWYSNFPNSIENIYPIYSHKALYEPEKVDEWIHDYIRDLRKLLDKAKSEGQEGLSHLKDTPISEGMATVILHKISGSGNDPGTGNNKEQCNACQLLPLGSPTP